MSGLAHASCRLTRVRDANSRSAKGWPGNRTKYSYDANGNANSRQGSSITWSSYNYPTTVNAGSGSTAETVSFSYGPDRGRWQQSYVGNSTQETTDYVGGLLEVVSSGGVTDYRHYINAGGEQIAVYSRKSSGTNTFSYLLSDHQASVASITSSSGTQVVGESFDAFGSRRNPTTWSGAASNSDLTTIAGITREGYTFQTALGLWMGMNHMNGRVEDSITGRFLSADPSIPDPSYSQSYNRYSYVNNNPLSQIDPSGFDNCPQKCVKPINPAGGGPNNPNYAADLQFDWSAGGPTSPTLGGGQQGGSYTQSLCIIGNAAPGVGDYCRTDSFPGPSGAPLGSGLANPGGANDVGGGGSQQIPCLPGVKCHLESLPPGRQQGNQPPPPANPWLCAKVGQGCQPAPPTPPPTTCPNGGTPSIANNPRTGRNIGYGMAIGGGTVGVGAAALFIYTFGFPEAEIATVAAGGTAVASGLDIGAMLGFLSSLGDPGLVALSAGSFGAAGGAAAAVGATPPMCP